MIYIYILCTPLGIIPMGFPVPPAALLQSWTTYISRPLVALCYHTRFSPLWHLWIATFARLFGIGPSMPSPCLENRNIAFPIYHTPWSQELPRECGILRMPQWGPLLLQVGTSLLVSHNFLCRLLCTFLRLESPQRSNKVESWWRQPRSFASKSTDLAEMCDKKLGLCVTSGQAHAIQSWRAHGWFNQQQKQCWNKPFKVWNQCGTEIQKACDVQVRASMILFLNGPQAVTAPPIISRSAIRTACWLWTPPFDRRPGDFADEMPRVTAKIRCLWGHDRLEWHDMSITIPDTKQKQIQSLRQPRCARSCSCRVPPNVVRDTCWQDSTSPISLPHPFLHQHLRCTNSEGIDQKFECLHLSQRSHQKHAPANFLKLFESIRSATAPRKGRSVQRHLPPETWMWPHDLQVLHRN